MTTQDGFLSLDISWSTPAEIATAGATTWNYIRIYKSGSENSGYNLVARTDLSTAVNCTFSVAPASTVTIPSHSFINGNLVGFATTNVLPSPLNANFLYYVINKTTDTFQLALVPGGTAIALTSTGSACQALKGTVYSQIASQVSSVWTAAWTDPTAQLEAKDSWYYLVRYYSSSTDTESKFYLTLKALTPREQRLVNMLKNWITPWMSSIVSDDDLRAGIVLAMNSINLYPPNTYFDLTNFPTTMEPLLIIGAAIFTLMYKYLGVAFTDFTYNDNGLSLTVDRSGKVKQASDMALAYYNQLLSLAKMDYAYGGSGVGTISMPLSLGGKMSANLLNVLDLFQATGR